MKSIKDKTVGQLVSENIKTAHIFKKYNIDFCCGGGITIDKTCEKHGIKMEELESELLNMDDAGKKYNYNSWSLSFLMSHIIQIHHQYVLETLPILESYAEKVAKVHGLNYPEVITIYKEILQVKEELFSHLEKEETILFPWISRLLEAEHQNKKIENASGINDPIVQLFSEHDDAGATFKKLSAITNKYTPPAGACNTFKALYNLLDEFENDLHLHIHLENNILFPKAIALSEKLKN